MLYKSTVTFREEGVDWNPVIGLVSNWSIWSPSARKVWIEIVKQMLPDLELSVTFREEGVDWNNHFEYCRIKSISHLPRGRCGLKSSCGGFDAISSWSPSARKVWIEIGLINCGVCGATSHLPRGRCGLKLECVPLLGVIESHLPRGRCGLKYVSLSRSEELYIVTFREEGVDWNISSNCPLFYFDVTFREEGVDWNRHYWLWHRFHNVTFREEGVDWNTRSTTACAALLTSPSARKVWIEIELRRSNECS